MKAQFDNQQALQQQMTQLLQSFNNFSIGVSAQPGPAPVEKKVQAVADPGKYEGGMADLEPWVAKMRLWLKANEQGLKTNFDQSAAVFSRISGKAARWAQERIERYTSSNSWPKGSDAVQDVLDAFQPGTHRLWARKRAQNNRQGSRFVEDWIAEMSALFRQGAVEEAHGKDILMTTVSDRIRKYVMESGMYDRAVSSQDLADAITKVGKRFQREDVLFGKGRIQEHQTPARPQQKPVYMGEPMEIGAATSGPSRPPPQTGCFVCGGPHWKVECPNRRQVQGGVARPQQGGNGRQPQPPRQMRQIAGPVSPVQTQDAQASQFKDMNYDEAKAFFFDMYETEVRQGKGEES